MNEINTNYNYANSYDLNSDYQNLTQPFGNIGLAKGGRGSGIEQGVTSILIGIAQLIQSFTDTKVTSQPTTGSSQPSSGILGKIGDFASIFTSATDIISVAKDIFTNPLGLLGKVTKLFK